MKLIHARIPTHTRGFKCILNDTLEVFYSVRLEHEKCLKEARKGF